MITEVIELMTELFPCGDDEWNIPKVHGLVWITIFIMLYGCEEVFRGGTSKQGHKDLVKDTSKNTQRRIATVTP